MKRTWLLVVATCTAMMLALPAHASGGTPTDMIGFENDPAGAKPNGWKSADSSIVSFSDSLGANLDVNNYGSQSKGQALAVNGDDQGYLQMRFSVPMCQLRLWFGNDDPGFSNPGDKARLVARDSGGAIVGQRAVVLNRDDRMNQKISFTGGPFVSADFWYAVTTSGLIEIVDNITATPC